MSEGEESIRQERRGSSSEKFKVEGGATQGHCWSPIGCSWKCPGLGLLLGKDLSLSVAN